MECRSIVAKGNVCPNCGSTKLTSKLEGYVVILDPASKLAEMLSTGEGEYAVTVM